MKKKFQLEVPGGADKVLLHTCCAPCSSAIIECLMQHGVTPVIYYCNPNIYPLEEYIIRKDECTRYAQSLGLEIIDADYDHDAWRCRMAGMEQEPERGGRCLRCFKMRLQETARYAHEHGFPHTELTATILLIIKIIFLNDSNATIAQSTFTPVLFPISDIRIRSRSISARFLYLFQTFPTAGSKRSSDNRKEEKGG